MIDGFAAPEFCQNFRLLVGALRRNKQGYGLADYFFGFVTKESFGARIPGGNNSVEILSYNRIVTRLNDRREPPRCLISPLPFSDIERDSDHLDGYAVLVIQAARGSMKPTPLTVCPLDSVFDINISFFSDRVVLLL